jgi:hypothetical protein
MLICLFIVLIEHSSPTCTRAQIIAIELSVNYLINCSSSENISLGGRARADVVRATAAVIGPVGIRVHDVIIKGNNRAEVVELLRAASVSTVRLHDLDIFDAVKTTLTRGRSSCLAPPTSSSRSLRRPTPSLSLEIGSLLLQSDVFRIIVYE